MNKFKKRFKKSINLPAYMTIEASLLMPGIIVLVGIIIYFSLFLYNHLVVYQSCSMAAIRGTQCKAMSDSAVKTFTEAQLQKLLERQIYDYTSESHVEVGGASINCRAATSIENRLISFGLYRERQLETERGASLIRLDPSTLIRNNRPHRGGNDD